MYECLKHRRFFVFPNSYLSDRVLLAERAKFVHVHKALIIMIGCRCGVKGGARLTNLLQKHQARDCI